MADAETYPVLLPMTYTPVTLLCPDPETCAEQHNEANPNTNEEHHYGCECAWCIQVYWSLKQ